MQNLKYKIFGMPLLLLSLCFLHNRAVAQQKPGMNNISIPVTNVDCEDTKTKNKTKAMVVISVSSSTQLGSCGYVADPQASHPHLAQSATLQVDSGQTLPVTVVRNDKNNQPCHYTAQVQNTAVIYGDSIDPLKPLYCKMDNNGVNNSCRCSN